MPSGRPNSHDWGNWENLHQAMPSIDQTTFLVQRRRKRVLCMFMIVDNSDSSYVAGKLTCRTFIEGPCAKIWSTPVLGEPQS